MMKRIARAPSPTALSNAAEAFKLLSDPTRLRIFWTLCHIEASPLQLAATLSLSAPAISHHLKQLKEGALVAARRQGKEVYYKAAKTPQTELLHRAAEEWMEISCPEWEKESCHVHDERKDSAIYDLHGYVAQNLHTHITIASLAKRFLMNPTTLQREFKEAYGTSLAAHIKEHRMKKAASLLKEGSLPVSDIARAVGYQNPSKFSAAFRAFFGISPLAYRKSQ